MIFLKNSIKAVRTQALKMLYRTTDVNLEDDATLYSEMLSDRSPFTLTGLAKQCGLNDFKLKRGFKEAFGDFARHLRLNAEYFN